MVRFRSRFELLGDPGADKIGEIFQVAGSGLANFFENTLLLSGIWRVGRRPNRDRTEEHGKNCNEDRFLQGCDKARPFVVVVSQM